MAATTDPLIGREIDGYKIETLLGKGERARLYRARDERLAMYFALKVIEPDRLPAPEAVRRFEKEARAIAHTQHPHIGGLHQFGAIDGLFYMAMQYIHGPDLSWLLSRYATAGKLMPQEDVLSIITQLASALAHAHSAGIIHRNLKPSNVMIDCLDWTNEGYAHLTDFGLAQLLIDDSSGSSHYIAPELAIRSADAVPQSDQYSLGVMFYEMLTGHVPFEGRSAIAHMTEPLPPLEHNPDLNSTLVEILERMLQKEPQDRYPDCWALADDMRRVLKGPPEPSSVAPYLSRLSVFQQVKDFRAAHPLPPLPDVSMPAQPRSRRSLTAKSTGSKSSITSQAQIYQWIWIAAVSALAVLIALIVITILLSG